MNILSLFHRWIKDKISIWIRCVLVYPLFHSFFKSCQIFHSITPLSLSPLSLSSLSLYIYIYIYIYMYIWKLIWAACSCLNILKTSTLLKHIFIEILNFDHISSENSYREILEEFKIWLWWMVRVSKIWSCLAAVELVRMMLVSGKNFLGWIFSLNCIYKRINMPWRKWRQMNL